MGDCRQAGPGSRRLECQRLKAGFILQPGFLGAWRWYRAGLWEARLGDRAHWYSSSSE